MDLPQQIPTQQAPQINTIAQIEEQVSPNGMSGPKMISQTVEKDRSVFVNLLAALGISIVAIVAVIFLLGIPFGAKKPAVTQPIITTDTLQIGTQPNVVVQTEYINPFASSAQYSNPFIATLNPFTAFAQQ